MDRIMMKNIHCSILFTLLVFAGCSTPNNSETSGFPKIDNNEKWKLNYNDSIIFDKQKNDFIRASGIEYLILKPKGIYQHTFVDKNKKVYSESSTYIFKKTANNLQSIELKEFAYFPDGIDYAIKNTHAEAVSLIIETSTSGLFGEKKRKVLCFTEPDLNLCFEKIGIATQ